MALHPTLARLVERAYRRGHGNLHTLPIPAIRQYYQSHGIPQIGDQLYQQIEVKSGVTIRLHYSLEHKTAPLIIYLRASGYIMGSPNDTDYFCHQLSKYLNCHVAAIEPRLSPEFKFPVPIEDCIEGIKYLYHHHNVLKIDPRNIILWGESSGGNMAAGIAHYFKNEKIAIIKHQVLFYPMLDFSNHHQYPSKSQFGEGYMMDNTLAEYFMFHYANSKKDYNDYRVSPLLDYSFENLPATTLIAAQYDPMRDEASAYIEKLIKSKVEVAGFIAPGMIHGFLAYTSKLQTAKFAQEYAVKTLKEKFLSC